MNIIAITAYNKPDLLFLYLEQIYKADLSNFKIRIHTEEGFDPDESEVVSFYAQKYSQVDIKLVVKKKVDCPLVGFHNILSSYTMSAKEADEFVIIGEEDMLPTDDYIAFNSYCYYNFLAKYDKIMCVGHKRRPEMENGGDPSVLIGDYQLTSPSCISKKIITKYLDKIFQHPLYFKDPVKFNKEIFHMSRIPYNEHTHHDGALERIMDVYKLFAIKPDLSRSMHVGLSGIFCKGSPPTGSLVEKIGKWRRLLNEGGDFIRKLSTMPQDIAVVPFNSPKWDTLTLDTSRNLAKASSWWYDTNNEFKKYIDNG